MVKRPSLFRKFELCAHTEQDAQGLVIQSNSVFPASKPALRSPALRARPRAVQVRGV